METENVYKGILCKPTQGWDSNAIVVRPIKGVISRRQVFQMVKWGLDNSAGARKL